MAGYGRSGFCGCCADNGPFDVYGVCHDENDPLSELLYRGATVIPAGQSAPYLSTSHPTPWSVQLGFEAEPPQEAEINQTLAAHFGTEMVWVVRKGNPQHPDAFAGPELLDQQRPHLWTQGADADYTSDLAMVVNTEDETDEATLTEGISGLAADTEYKLGLVASSREARWLRVEIHNFDSITGSKIFWIDLDDLVGTTVPIEELEEGEVFKWVVQVHEDKYEHIFLLVTSTDGPGLSPEIELRLVDGDGLDTFEGEIGDGVLFYTASLRAVTEEPSALPEVFLVNAQSGEVLLHHFPRKHLPVSFRDPAIFVSQVDVVQSNIASRVATFAASWANEASMGFPSGTACIHNVGAPSVSERWGPWAGEVSDFTGEEASNRFFWEQGGPSPQTLWQTGDAGSLNSRSIIPRLVGNPPHDWPNVVTHSPAKPQMWEYPVYLPDIDEFTPARYDRVYGASVTSLCKVGYGNYFLTADMQRTHREIHHSLPGGEQTTIYNAQLLTGPPDGIWSKSHTQTVLRSETASLTPPAYESTGNPLDDELNEQVQDQQSLQPDAVVMTVQVLECDGQGGTGAAILTYRRHYWDYPTGTSWDGETQPPEENPMLTAVETIEDRFVLAIAGTDIIDLVVYTPGFKYAQSITACYGGGWAYFRKLFEPGHNPSAEEPDGIQIGWRLVLPTGNHIDNKTPGDFPQIITTSNRHLFVRGFTLCDVRLAGDEGTDWIISRDGSYTWGVRQIVDGAADEPLDLEALNEGGTFTIVRDSVKNSGQLPLTPAVDQYADRSDFEHVDNLLGDPETWSKDFNAEFEDDKLSTNAGAETADAEIYEDGGTSNPRTDYRWTIEAKADEATRLLVRLEDFHGAAVHAEAWLNLDGGTISSSDGWTATAVEEDEDEAGRYTFTLSATPAEEHSFTGRIRLVDSSGGEVFTGAIGEGAFVYSAVLSTKCKAGE